MFTNFSLSSPDGHFEVTWTFSACRVTISSDSPFT